MKRLIKIEQIIAKKMCSTEGVLLHELEYEGLNYIQILLADLHHSVQQPFLLNIYGKQHNTNE